jgi:hypothetical protein
VHKVSSQTRRLSVVSERMAGLSLLRSMSESYTLAPTGVSGHLPGGHFSAAKWPYRGPEYVRLEDPHSSGPYGATMQASLGMLSSTTGMRA